MSRAPHRFRPALSLRGHPLDVIDHNELDGPFSRLQSESQPILNYLLLISERDTRVTRAATHTRRMLPFRRSPFSDSGWISRFMSANNACLEHRQRRQQKQRCRWFGRV